jgi:hypothetical protein
MRLTCSDAAVGRLAPKAVRGHGVYRLTVRSLSPRRSRVLAKQVVARIGSSGDLPQAAADHRRRSDPATRTLQQPWAQHP